MTEPRRPLGPRRQRRIYLSTDKRMLENLKLGKVNAAALRDRTPHTGPNQSTEPWWTPLGPSAVLDVANRYVVGGRVHDLAVSDDGVRAYAATPRGGVWYTGDAGARWVPLQGWGYDRDRDFSSGLASSCLLVHFGASAQDDFVMVGTGEPDMEVSAVEPARFGIGVLFAKGPAVAGSWLNYPLPEPPHPAQPADPEQPPPPSNPVLKTNLSIVHMARHPDARPETFVASTVGGKTWQEDRVVAVVGLDYVYLGTWTVDYFTWQPILTRIRLAALGQTGNVSNVVWVRATTGRDGRIVVALAGGTLLHSDDAGLTWGVLAERCGTRPMFALADGVRLYVLGHRPGTAMLWRMADPPATGLVEVGPAPDLVDEPDSDDTVIHDGRTIAVRPEPGGADLVVLGGGATGREASLWAYRTRADGAPGLVPAADLTGDDPGPWRAGFLGTGVYPDVNAIQVVDQGRQLWVATDGGVFVSTERGQRRTFAARSVGLAAIDSNFLATHPKSSQYLALGAKHTGLLVRSGDSVWSEVGSTEGGGVVFNSVPPFSLVGQHVYTDWVGQARFFRSPVPTAWAAGPQQDREAKASGLFSGAAMTTTTSSFGSRLAVGTNRVWITDNHEFGPTFWKALPYTQPGAPPQAARNPRAQGRDDAAEQSFGVPVDGDLGPFEKGTGPLGPVVTIKWVSSTELLALFGAGLVRWRENAQGLWSSELLVTTVHTQYQPTDVCPVPGGGYYLAIREIGRDELDIDTCIFVDANGARHPTELRVRGEVVDPAFSVVVDPLYPDQVYVGTYTGVWGSVRLGITHGPWTLVGRGLPAGAVQDLGIWVDPDHDPQHPERALRLLRAATQARGVWELELSDTQPARTYLRVHRADDRLRLPTPLARTRPAPEVDDDEPVLASPDIVVRPRFGTTAHWAGIAPWYPDVIDAKNARRHAYTVWAAQTALRWLYPAVTADGRWSDRFVAALRAFAARTGLTMDRDELTKPMFEAIVTGIKLPFDPANPTATPANPANLPAAVFRAPWHTRADPQACATELDIVQSVVGSDESSWDMWYIDRPLCTVDVLIHHRSTEPLGARGAFCVLLWRSVDIGVGRKAMMALSADGLAPYARAVAAATNPAAVPEPAGWGWNVVKVGSNPLHRLPVTLDASMPRAVSIDVDFTTADWDILLVAIAGSLAGSAASSTAVSSADQLTKPAPPPGTSLGDFLRRWPYAAARFVRPFPRLRRD